MSVVIQRAGQFPALSAMKQLLSVDTAIVQGTEIGPNIGGPIYFPFQSGTARTVHSKILAGIANNAADARNTIFSPEEYVEHSEAFPPRLRCTGV